MPKSQLKTKDLILTIHILNKTLKKYGRHLRNCDIERFFGTKCTCGFEKVLDGKEVIDNLHES
jgi:hypothetical protein